MNEKNKERLILIGGVIIILLLYEAYKIYQHVQRVNQITALEQQYLHVIKSTSMNLGNQ
jgi:predicted negative regulator of RcsB-dependent stress response